jgi:hypothetical protein
MPKLRRSVADGHYFIRAFIHGAGGLATYAVSAQALEYMHSRGIKVNDEIPRATFNRLRTEELIFTGGGGMPPGIAAVDIPPRIFDALIAWGETGDIDGLEGAVRDVQSSVAECITPSFIAWASAFENQVTLADLIEIKESDFSYYARLSRANRGKLNSLQLGLLENEGGCRVLWHFVRHIAFVATHPGFPNQLPQEWEGTIYEVLSRLVQDGLQEVPEAPIQSTKLNIQMPAIYWKMYDQQVVGILPSQTIPKNGKLSWLLAGQGLPLDIRQLNDKAVVSTQMTPPLDPESWSMEVRYKDGEIDLLHKIETCIPSSNGPYVFFEPDGKAISWEDGLPFGLGQYHVLVAPEADDIRDEDVTVLDEIDFEPVGWEDWKGYLLSIEKPLTLGRYKFGVSDANISWQLQERPDLPVDMLEPIPTWLGRWPKVEINCSDVSAFTGGYLTLRRQEDGFEQVIPWDSDLMGGLIGSGDDGSLVLDLFAHEHLATRSGNMQLSFRPARVMANHLKPLSFRVLMGIDFVYVEDSQSNLEAKGLWVDGAQEVTALPGSQKHFHEESGFVVRAENPVQENLVHIGVRTVDLDEEIFLSVHLPVSRIRLQSRSRPLGVWQSLPMDIHLPDHSDITTRLKLQLCDAPETEYDGRFLCFLDGNEPLIVGKEVLPGSYEIPLHRWRDALGIHRSGIIQVSCNNHMHTIVNLIGLQAPEPVEDQPVMSPKSQYDSWFEKMKCLEILAVECNCEELTEEAKRFAHEIDKKIQIKNIKTLLKARLSRACAFAGLHDLRCEVIGDHGLLQQIPLVRYCDLSVQVRGEQDWEYGQVQKKATEMGQENFRQMVLAEASYRLGRRGRGGDGALSKVTGTYLNGWKAHLFIERASCEFLRVLTLFLRRHPIVFDPDFESIPWYRALSLAYQYLTTPLSQWQDKDAGDSAHSHWPALIATEDAQYIEAILAQASGDILAARKYLDELGHSRLNFPHMDLVLARQRCFEGDKGQAREFYHRNKMESFYIDEMMHLEL